MNPEKKPVRLPVIAVIAAVLVGVGAASFQHLRLRMQPDEAGPDLTHQSRLDTVTVGAATQDAGPRQPELLVSYVEPDVEIQAGPGIVLRAARENGDFIGFEVLEGSADSRLEPGRIIISINGMPVEDSAAGSELLVAALADQDSQVIFAGEER